MAITRAQQAKQMLQNGGRIGLRFGNRGPGQASRESRDNRDRGMGMGGKQRSAPTRDTGDRNPMAQFSGGANTEGVTFMDQARRDVNPLGILTELPGTIGIVSRALTPNPFGFSRARRSFPTSVGGGGDSQATADMFIPAYIRAGFNTQEEYDEFLASQREDASVDDKIKRSLAFKADGGRVGAQEGGIMPRLNQLGSGVSSAEQMLQGINQRLESAESTLGGGSGLRVPEGNMPTNTSMPENVFMGNMNPGSADSFKPLGGMFDGKQFDSVKSAYDYAVKSAADQRAGGFMGRMVLPGEMGFEGFSGLFNRLNDPNAPQPQLASAPISGIPAAGYADGGNVVGGEFDFESARQMYGLGKLVKKVTKTVKKIAKSPIGKAALLYAGGTYLGGLKTFGGAGFGSGTFLSNLKSGQGIANLGGFLKGKLIGSATTKPGTSSGGIFNFIKDNPFLTTAAVSAIGALTPEEELQAQELADSSTDFDLEKARNSILAAKREQYMMDVRARGFKAEGGPAEDKEPVAKKTMPLLDMGGKEMDLREEGGFVPIGRMEKADDVPARLSKNEFVFTADAVRNAGDGDVDKGAEVMYNMMKNLEAGGEVSEESQGLEGARKMFQTSQRLEEVL